MCKDNTLILNSPYNPCYSQEKVPVKAVLRVTYVDRSKAVRGSYPFSHLNLHFKDNHVKYRRWKISLDKDECKSLSETLESFGVSLKITEDMEQLTL